MASRGGARPGAGRKKGSIGPRERLQQQIQVQALQSGCSPLDVMLEAMREAYQEGGAKAAMPYAKEAAPYLHAKLSSVDAKVDGVIGQYAAQPIPVEVRDPIPEIKTNGHSKPS